MGGADGSYRPSPYRTGYDAHAAAPHAARPAAAANWGHCVSGLQSEAASAYPSWNLCQ